jgi:hypothetical protein
MGTYTRASSKMEIDRAKEPTHGLINPTTKENG